MPPSKSEDTSSNSSSSNMIVTSTGGLLDLRSIRESLAHAEKMAQAELNEGRARGGREQCDAEDDDGAEVIRGSKKAFVPSKQLLLYLVR